MYLLPGTVGAYPRRRGGNRCPLSLRNTAQGLSPQARGKPKTLVDGGADPGPIPAGAGETILRFARACALRAYPRRRGGNCPGKQSDGRSQGLSPQARGKRRQRAYQTKTLGPIPAGAGETCCRARPAPGCGAYPRRRGGNVWRLKGHARQQGLSPQARGKHCAASLRRAATGPIPAGAGETLERDTGSLAIWAYPRRRGGNTRYVFG